MAKWVRLSGVTQSLAVKRGQRMNQALAACSRSRRIPRRSRREPAIGLTQIVIRNAREVMMHTVKAQADRRPEYPQRKAGVSIESLNLFFPAQRMPLALIFVSSKCSKRIDQADCGGDVQPEEAQRKPVHRPQRNRDGPENQDPHALPPNHPQCFRSDLPAVIYVHTERREVDQQPSLESRDSERDWGEEQKSNRQCGRQQQTLRGESNCHTRRARKRKIFRIPRCSVRAQADGGSE